MAQHRYAQLLEARMALDAQGMKKKASDLTRPHPLDAHISTTFESVEIFHYSAEELAMGNKQRVEGTQLPSTLYNLEHSGSQSQGQGRRGARESGKEDEDEQEWLDAEWFGTQAFREDLAELERQHEESEEGEDVGDDAAHDETAERKMEGVSPATQGKTAQPGTPSRKREFTPKTPTSQTPLARPTHTPFVAPRSALKTPSRLATTQSAVRFASPLKRRRDAWQSDGDEEDGEEGRKHLSSSQEAGSDDLLSQEGSKSSLHPPSQQNGHPEAGADPASGPATRSHSHSHSHSSPEWFSAHLRAQTRWRESAHSQILSQRQATQGAAKQGSDTLSQTTPPFSTVPALTQLARSSDTSTSATHASASSSSSAFQPALPSIKGREPNTYLYAIPAPTQLEVTASMQLFGLSPVEYQDPYYSDPRDVPVHAREYAGRSWRFGSKTIRWLPDWPGSEAASTRETRPQQRAGPQEGPAFSTWAYGPPPPTRLALAAWDRQQRRKRKRIARYRRRIASQSNLAPTQAPSFGFKISQRVGSKAQPRMHTVAKENQHMTLLSIEVHVNTRGSLLPDPKKDRVEAIAYSFQNEDEQGLDPSASDSASPSLPGLRTGLILLDDTDEPLRADRLGLTHLPCTVVDSELDLFNALVDVVRQLDPEILAGWEIHNASWGYVIDRARHELGYDLVPELSRVNSLSTGMAGGKADNWGWTQTSALKVTGRHILNVWRLMRGELNLNVYTYENVVFHLLRSRVPRFPHSTLTTWYTSRRPHQVSRALRYHLSHSSTTLHILHASELIFRTAEFARIYGIDFFSVLSRGSQFKVESVMFRIAKPESFLLPSPSTKQVAEQNAAECLPLIMEPQSAFYKGPLLVLDFQSLYPSVMVAYNICYSTCLGRVARFDGREKFGECAPRRVV